MVFQPEDSVFYDIFIGVDCVYERSDGHADQKVRISDIGKHKGEHKPLFFRGIVSGNFHRQNNQKNRRYPT